jgi:hypothetical protein
MKYLTHYLFLASICLVSCEVNDDFEKLARENELLKFENDSLLNLFYRQEFSTIVRDKNYPKVYKTTDTLVLNVEIIYNEPNIKGKAFAQIRQDEKFIQELMSSFKDTSSYKKFEIITERNNIGEMILKVTNLTKGENIIGGVYEINDGEKKLPFFYKFVVE